jgi:hypothetical protein
MLMFSIGLVVISLLSPNLGHLAALAFTFSGLFYYFPFVYYKKSFKFTDKLSMYIQIILNCASETTEETSEEPSSSSSS